MSTALGAALGLCGVLLGIALLDLTSAASYAQLVGAVALAMLLGGRPAGVAAIVVSWGLGAFVLWIPVRILIWVARDEDKALFSGHAPVLRPGQVFGHLVIASALGMLGGWLGGRAVARSRARTRTPGDPSAS